MGMLSIFRCAIMEHDLVWLLNILTLKTVRKLNWYSSYTNQWNFLYKTSRKNIFAIFVVRKTKAWNRNLTSVKIRHDSNYWTTHMFRIYRLHIGANTFEFKYGCHLQQLLQFQTAYVLQQNISHYKSCEEIY